MGQNGRSQRGGDNVCQFEGRIEKRHVRCERGGHWYIVQEREKAKGIAREGEGPSSKGVGKERFSGRGEKGIFLEERKGDFQKASVKEEGEGKASYFEALPIKKRERSSLDSTAEKKHHPFEKEEKSVDDILKGGKRLHSWGQEGGQSLSKQEKRASTKVLGKRGTSS